MLNLLPIALCHFKTLFLKKKIISEIILFVRFNKMFGMNFFPEMPRPFNTQYRCYPVAMLPGSERSDVEAGGKIIMPPSALDQLTRLNIVYPMLFKLSNKKNQRTTHCGVLEFVADEGKIYIPYWMMQNLMLEEGGLVQVHILLSYFSF